MSEYQIHTIRIRDVKPKGFGPEDICLEPKSDCVEQLAKDGYAFVAESMQRAQAGSIRIPFQPLKEYVEELERWRQKIAEKQVPAQNLQMGIEGLQDWGKSMDPAMAQSASFQHFFADMVTGIIELRFHHLHASVAAQRIKMLPPSQMYMDGLQFMFVYVSLIEMDVRNLPREIGRFEDLVKASIRVKLDWVRNNYAKDPAFAATVLEYAEKLQGPFTPRGHQNPYGRSMVEPKPGPFFKIEGFEKEIDDLKKLLKTSSTEQ